MNKLFNILMVICLAVFIFGCEGEGEEKRQGATPQAFVGGDKGLDIKFVAGAPPTEVYDTNYPFNVNIRVENVGEYSVPAGQAKFKIQGIDPKDFGNPTLDKTNTNELIAARLDPQGNSIAGTIDNIDFSNLQAARVTGNIEYTIRGEVCYPYKTSAVSQVCILEDVLGTTRKAGEKAFCEVNEDKKVENSGAPVKITNLKEIPTAKDKISFSFDVTHVGSGQVFSTSSANCASTLETKNKVRVKVDTGITGGQLSCQGLVGATNEGEITLYSKEAGKESISVRCTQILPARTTDSEKQIKIDLTYNYKQFVDTNILVKHSE